MKHHMKSSEVRGSRLEASEEKKSFGTLNKFYKGEQNG